MKKFISWKILLIIVAALVLGFFDLPAETQKSILPFAPDSFTNNKIHLGLDLQGGSQLDYKIDLRKVPDEDQQDIIDGVLNVIEKRVNGLGVAEPNIYVSEIADEYHITVELAETAAITQEDVDTYLGENKNVGELTDDEKKLVSLEKAKATVGKTIQLEFKERKDTLDPQEKEKIKENALQALNKINAGEEFSLVGLEEQQAFPGQVTYKKSNYIFEDEIPESIKSTILNFEVGDYTAELVESGGTYTIDESGNTVEETGLTMAKLSDTKEEIKNEKEVYASHILITWAGLESADASIIRTEDEAYDIIKELENKIENGADFATVAKENSEDKANSADGGALTAPITGDGSYVYDFEQATMDFENPGDLSEIIKTKFGYHLIKANRIETNVPYTKYQYETITYSTLPDPWKETGLTGKHFVHADVQVDNYFQPYVLIQFNDEGAKLFGEITERNVNKQVAIFVGGQLVSAPRVNEAITSGSAQINGDFTSEEAKNLARDLNTGAIPAPIILTGEYTIGATLGQEALNTSLFAGLIGLILVMVFMVFNYRLAGLIADLALGVYAALLIFLIKSQLHLGIALVLALIVFIFLIVKIVNNKDSGWEKMLSFILSCIGFFFLTYLLKTGVVLTLAGVAGIILSIGMAVDANILIFERFKEELKEGKSYGAALNDGFNRAWSAIRDSNFSTLLTCAILFYFGSSIIKGFAFNLAAGILVSMFTAITVTKTLLAGFIGKKIAQNIKVFGANPHKKESHFKFIAKSKIWLSISGILVAASIVSMFVFGLKLGIDFKGGTLLEFQFSEPVQKEMLADTLVDIEGEINSRPEITTELEATETPAESSLDTPVLSENVDTTVDLTNIIILESGESNYIVKTKYLTSESHDQLLAEMQDRLPSFTEPRFTTIGPTIGKTLLHKAIIAIAFALLMIIVYIGFAFRKIPKEVNPWRFGVTAIIALLHDVIIVTGVFAVLGAFLNVELDALFITALLTVFGYSVNDTIVIFDRIRENLIHSESHESVGETVNKSLNQTLRRSLNTSVSTLVVLIAVLIWGSPSIFYFVLALTLGTFIGTYSSIFTASPILLKWNKWAKRKEIQASHETE
ncbi:MAG: protein translocase subunit SecF [Nitrospirae bacterium]|nr:protein translocase subunit SecF [Nitrospirota bacterium]